MHPQPNAANSAAIHKESRVGISGQVLRVVVLQELVREGLFGSHTLLLQIGGTLDQVTSSSRQLVHGVVVGLLRLLQAVSNAFHVFGKVLELVEHTAGFLGNVSGVLNAAFVLPDTGDGAKGGQQGGTLVTRH